MVRLLHSSTNYGSHFRALTLLRGRASPDRSLNFHISAVVETGSLNAYGLPLLVVEPGGAIASSAIRQMAVRERTRTGGPRNSPSGRTGDVGPPRIQSDPSLSTPDAPPSGPLRGPSLETRRRIPPWRAATPRSPSGWNSRLLTQPTFQYLWADYHRERSNTEGYQPHRALEHGECERHDDRCLYERDTVVYDRAHHTRTTGLRRGRSTGALQYPKHRPVYYE